MIIPVANIKKTCGTALNKRINFCFQINRFKQNIGLSYSTVQSFGPHSVFKGDSFSKQSADRIMQKLNSCKQTNFLNINHLQNDKTRAIFGFLSKLSTNGWQHQDKLEQTKYLDGYTIKALLRLGKGHFFNQRQGFCSTKTFVQISWAKKHDKFPRESLFEIFYRNTELRACQLHS